LSSKNRNKKKKGTNHADGGANQILGNFLAEVLSGRTGELSNQAVGGIYESMFGTSDGSVSGGDCRAIFRKILNFVAKRYCKLAGRIDTPAYVELISKIALRSLAKGDLSLLEVAMTPAENVSREYVCVCSATSGFIFRAIGESIENTKRFCELLFREISSTIEHGISLPEAKQSAYFGQRPPLFARITIQAAVLPCDEAFSSKRWIVNLIRAAGKGDRDVDDYLRGILELLASLNRSIAIYTPAWLDERQGESAVAAEPVPGQFDFQKPHILIPDDCEQPLVDFITADRASKDRMYRESRAFKERFVDRQNDLRAAFRRMCDEIRDNVQCELLPDGHDRVEIDLSALRFSGIRAVAFYPNGHEFPNCGLKIGVRKDAYALCWFPAELVDFQLIVNDHVLENAYESDLGYLREVLLCVIVYALHAIVVGSDDEQRSVEAVPGCSMVRCIRQARRDEVRIMRARFRRLPDGYTASKTAHELARSKSGWRIPPGKTYVQRHERTFSKASSPITIRCSDANFMEV